MTDLFRRKSVDFGGRNQSSDVGLLLLRHAELAQCDGSAANGRRAALDLKT
jgi:hypothetical protein